MKLILHDLTDELASALLPKVSLDGDHDIKIFSALPRVKPCTSCFGCWLKTPGMCVIEDRAQDFMKLLARADGLYILSRLLYGGLSTEVKTVMDRSLGFILPYFDIQEDRMHHPPRYDNDLKIHYHMYSADGSELLDIELAIMHEIAAANTRNLSAQAYTCDFYDDINELPEYLK